MASTPYKDTEFGIAEYPHFNEPDTAFNRETTPLYHGKIVFDGEYAQNLREELDAAAEAAAESFFRDDPKGAKITAGERKKWTILKPYEEVEDDDGNTTGAIRLHVKQNAKINVKGTTKNIEIGIYDAKGNAVKKQVFGGSVIRVSYSLRDIVVAGTKSVGVRADFSKIQVKEWSKGSSAKGFGAVEGEDVADDQPDYQPSAPEANGNEAY